jgi:hypothetical protein
MATKKPPQDWTPGSTVTVGGREYRVEGPGPEANPPKGESRGHIIVDPRNGYRYLWRAYRGLAIQDGHELVRDRRKEHEARRRQAATNKPKARQAAVGKARKVPVSRQAPVGRPVAPPAQEQPVRRGMWSKLKALIQG